MYNSDYPWLTAGAVEFLKTFLEKNTKADVLEFGCGGSTKWLSPQVNKLISIEHDLGWATKIGQEIPANTAIMHVPRPCNIVCAKFEDEAFDFILVDGRDRVACVLDSIRLLKPNGFLMLDNAERVEYRPAIDKLKLWPKVTTTGPGYDGTWNWRFHIPEWETTWWQKPN